MVEITPPTAENGAESQPAGARGEIDAPPSERVIAGHPFLRRLSEPHLQMLAECASRAEFDAGALIFRRGEPANRFYLIESGEVSVELPADGQGTIYIQTVGAGEELGWSWLFPPHAWRFDARVVRPTRVIFFYGQWLRELCDQDAEFGYALMSRTAQIVTARLQATREHLVALSRLALESQCQTLRLAGKKLGRPTRQLTKKL
jgi:CRP-like cAMP-binding protein